MARGRCDEDLDSPFFRYVAVWSWARARGEWAEVLGLWPDGTSEDLRTAASWLEEKRSLFSPPFSHLEVLFTWAAKHMDKLDQAREALLDLELPDGSGPVFKKD